MAIGDRAFQSINNLHESTRLDCSTLERLGTHCFNYAFNVVENENRDLVISGSVVSISNSAFANQNSTTHFNTLQIGTPENKSDLTSFSNAFSGNGTKFNQVIIYSNKVTELQNLGETAILNNLFNNSYNSAITLTIL